MKTNFKKSLLVVPFGLALLVLPSCGTQDGAARDEAAAKNPAATEKDKDKVNFEIIWLKKIKY